MGQPYPWSIHRPLEAQVESVSPAPCLCPGTLPDHAGKPATSPARHLGQHSQDRGGGSHVGVRQGAHRFADSIYVFPHLRRSLARVTQLAQCCPQSHPWLFPPSDTPDLPAGDAEPRPHIGGFLTPSSCTPVSAAWGALPSTADLRNPYTPPRS